jgi:hypothetical protein
MGPVPDSSLVLARNPRTGGLNVSVHRMMNGEGRMSFLIDRGGIWASTWNWRTAG